MKPLKLAKNRPYMKFSAPTSDEEIRQIIARDSKMMDVEGKAGKPQSRNDRYHVMKTKMVYKIDELRYLQDLETSNNFYKYEIPKVLKTRQNSNEYKTLQAKKK